MSLSPAPDAEKSIPDKRPPFHDNCDCFIRISNVKISSYSMTSSGVEPNGTYGKGEIVRGSNCIRKDCCK